MPETMFIKPAAGLLIRFPDDPARQLAAAGETVPCSSFWLRRLRDGSVVSASAPKGGK